MKGDFTLDDCTEDSNIIDRQGERERERESENELRAELDLNLFNTFKIVIEIREEREKKIKRFQTHYGRKLIGNCVMRKVF